MILISLFPVHSIHTPQVTSLWGNDFMPLLVSFITGRDWRPYMDMRGIPMSNLTRQQIQAHLDSGRINATTIADFPLVSYNIEIPQASMTGVPVVPVDGYSRWPKDNLYDPRYCPNVALPPGDTFAPTMVRTVGPVLRGCGCAF